MKNLNELKNLINTEHDLVTLLEELNERYGDPEVLQDYEAILNDESINFSLLLNEDEAIKYVTIFFEILEDNGMFEDEERPNVEIKVTGINIRD